MRPVRRTLAAACLSLLSAAPAIAGAWPREPGKIFVSIRGDYETGTGETRTKLYGEYGLTRRITFGFEASDGPPDEAKQEEYEWQLEHGDALVLFPPSRRRVGSFVNVAIGPLETTNRFAVSLGASAPPDQYGLMMEYRIEAAAHWGRGFSSRWGDGWATATAKVIVAKDEDEPITDFHGLVGLKPRDGWMGMLSLGRYTDESGTTWKVSPSIGYRPHEKVWVVPTLTYGFGDGDSETAFGLGFWLSF
jgi:hypothetical protein